MKIWSVSGSRHFTDYDGFSERMRTVIKLLKETPDKIHVGDCRGTDTLTVRWCHENDVSCEVFEADWDKHGRAAGPIRNKQLLKRTSTLIAFLASASRGTKNCINQAQKMKLKVVTVSVHV